MALFVTLVVVDIDNRTFGVPTHSTGWTLPQVPDLLGIFMIKIFCHKRNY